MNLFHLLEKNLIFFVTLKVFEGLSVGNLPRNGGEDMLGLLTLDSHLLTQPLLQTWTTSGFGVPIIFGKYIKIFQGRRVQNCAIVLNMTINIPGEESSKLCYCSRPNSKY